MAQMLRKTGSSNSYLAALHRVSRALRILPDGADYVRSLQGAGEALEATQRNSRTLKLTLMDLRVDLEMAGKNLYSECKTLHGRAGELDRADMTSSVLSVLFHPSGKLTSIPRKGQELADAARVLLGRLQGLGSGHPLAERAAAFQERIAAFDRTAAGLRSAEQAQLQARDQERLAQQIVIKAYDDAYLAVRGKYGAHRADEIFRYATISRSKSAPEPDPKNEPTEAATDSAGLLEMTKNLFKHLLDLQQGETPNVPSAPANPSVPLLSAPSEPSDPR